MKQNLVKIQANTLLDLIWNASRYCCGRQSYACSYAEDYWQLIRANRKQMNETRLRFFARDLRSEVSTYLGFYKGMHIENTSNDRIRYDAHSLMCEWCMNHPDADVTKGEFYIDCIKGTVEQDLSMNCGDEDDIIDELRHFPLHYLEYWCKLANAIDRQEPAIVRRGEESEIVGVVKRVEYARYADGTEGWFEVYNVPDKGFNSYVAKDAEIVEAPEYVRTE
jgi:hypothetical protein